MAQLRVQSKSGTATPRLATRALAAAQSERKVGTMGCPRGATIASAALLYLAYYLRCCVKDLAVRSPAVGALAAHRMPAYLYRSNNDTKLLAHLARAATAGADEPAFLAPACAAGTPSFNALVKARMARDRRPVLAALTDKALVKR